MAGRAAGDAGLKVRVVSIGKDRSGLFAPAVEEYAQRLKHYARFELIELPEARGQTVDQRRKREAEALLSRKGPQDLLVALDETGRQLTSEGLSAYVDRARTDARDLLLVIGGDDGLDASVREAAQLVLSLSAMTLPHRLARVVLVEQLYRAFTLIHGEPYHRR